MVDSQTKNQSNRNSLAKSLSLVVFFSSLCVLIFSAAVIAFLPGPPGTSFFLLALFALPASVLTALASFYFGIRPIQRTIVNLSDLLTSDHAPLPSPTQDPEDSLPSEIEALYRAANHIWYSCDELKNKHVRLQKIFDNSNDAILISRLDDGQIIDCNPKARFMLGYTEEEIRKLNFAEITQGNQSISNTFISEILEKGYGWSDEIIYRTRSGKKIPAEVSGSLVQLHGEKFILSMVRDISDRRAQETRIAHLAYHDSLTDLPNRTLLKDRITRTLIKCRRSGTLGAIFFLDLDNFKRINDSLGHSAGDQLLQDLAIRLKSRMRAEDTVSRLSGDEFVILLDNLGHDDASVVQQVHALADKVRDILAEPYLIDSRELYVTGSIGIVMFPTQANDVESLLRHADTAMYYAKAEGRNRYRIFEQAMDEAVGARLALENEIRQALQKNQFCLYFQPIQSTSDNRLTGAEALLRWQHPVEGLVTPGNFLATLEDSSLMINIDNWVLETTLNMLAQLQRAGELMGFSYLSVNISQLQFHQPGFISNVKDLLASTGANPGLIQFEITESVIIRDSKASIKKLKMLKDLGIQLAIDNFGTGYSSLTYLNRMPFDALKIDRSFIGDLTIDSNDKTIVETIISMAEHFKLTAIAEGVETQEQKEFLGNAGCTLYQGYLASHPLPTDEFLDLYTSWVSQPVRAAK